MVVDDNERIILVNQRFSEEYGYSSDDIPTWEDWLVKAFPDSENRQKAISATYKGPHFGRDCQSDIMLVRCRDNSDKNVILKPVPLSGGVKIIFLNPNNIPAIV